MIEAMDIAILGLVGFVLGHNWRLSRKVENLKDLLIRIEPNLTEFSASVDRSEKVVANMRDVAKRSGDSRTEPVPASRDSLSSAFYQKARERGNA